MASTDGLLRGIFAMRLRDSGLTYREIGELMGCHTSRAHQLVNDPTFDQRNEYRRRPQRSTCEQCGDPIQQTKGSGGRTRFCKECKATRHRDRNRTRWQTSKYAHNERRRVINLTPVRAAAKRISSRMDYIRQGSPTSPEEIRVLFCDPCAYCGAPTDLGVDHIVPIIAGGGGEWDNLTACCLPCNASKKDTPMLLFLSRKVAAHG